MNETENYLNEGDGSAVGGLGAMDFDVNAEYKADPVIPNGSYRGSVTAVKFDSEKFCIVWDVVMQDNGGFASDGESPVDGMRVQYRNWLPKPGDENEYAKNGKTTKRQSKINMMKKFAEGMKIDISTPNKIAEAIQYQTWVGTEVKCDVQIKEWQGDIRNEINKMTAA